MKSIVISGADGGLGKVIAGLCVKNIEVINISRIPYNIEYGINISCDLGKSEEIDSAINMIKEKYSSFDAIIKCVACSYESRLF